MLNKDLQVRLKHEKDMQAIEREMYILERIQNRIHGFKGMGSEKVKRSQRRIWQRIKNKEGFPKIVKSEE